MKLPLRTASAFAPAKINLTLHVTGRRADGYHLLSSLVVFDDIGDRVEVTQADGMSLQVTGPMAAGVPGDRSNLVWQAAEWFGTPPVAIRLEKHLPMAAGIGGGSSDAAATLRALARCFGREPARADETVELGADIPVCLTARPCLMSAAGGTVDILPGIPALHMVLVNPQMAVRTGQVFAALDKKDNAPMTGDVPLGATAAELCAWLSEQRNDLEPSARAVEPAITGVLNALSELDALLVRMSGSGATCFAIFADEKTADKAAGSLRGAHPDWWIVRTVTSPSAL